MRSVPNTPPILPPEAPPLVTLVTNTYETGNVAGPNGAHRFAVVAFSAHIVVDATRINGHINSNN